MRNKIRYWMILFFLVIVALIGIFFSQKKHTKSTISNKVYSKYRGKYSDTLIYGKKGILQYRLVTNYVEFFSEKNISRFIKPVLIIYDEIKGPTWSIRSDKAELINNQILYLYGNVKISLLIDNTQQLKEITTENAKINLISQDITSKNVVTISGTSFYSQGMRMKGNFRKKSAELIEKVKTLYEFNNR